MPKGAYFPKTMPRENSSPTKKLAAIPASSAVMGDSFHRTTRSRTAANVLTLQHHAFLLNFRFFMLFFIVARKAGSFCQRAAASASFFSGKIPHFMGKNPPLSQSFPAKKPVLFPCSPKSPEIPEKGTHSAKHRFLFITTYRNAFAVSPKIWTPFTSCSSVGVEKLIRKA